MMMMMMMMIYDDDDDVDVNPDACVPMDFAVLDQNVIFHFRFERPKLLSKPIDLDPTYTIA
jgi:hypothetical protein